MENLCVFVILALVSTQAFAASYRYRRQTDMTEDSNELEDRYGWNMFATGRFPPRPWRPNQFPNQNQNQGKFPNQNQNQGQLPSTTAAPNNVNSAQTTQCLRSCPVTPEYNPVCGSNNVTYDNPGRLYCAQSCGVNVNFLRSSRCPASAVAN